MIKKHPNAHQKYVERLLQEGVITEDEVREVHNRIQGILQDEFEMAKEHVVSEQEWLSNVWAGFNSPSQRSRIRNTGAAPCLHEYQAATCHGILCLLLIAALLSMRLMGVCRCA